MTGLSKSKKNPPPSKQQNVKNKDSIIKDSIIKDSIIKDSIIEGISFGVGSSIGHNIVNKVSGYFSNDTSSCSDILKILNECKNNSNDCSELVSQYKKCNEK